MEIKSKSFFDKIKYIIFLFTILLLGVLFFVFLPKILGSHYVLDESAALVARISTTTSEKVVFTPSYIPTPSVVKGIYMTSWVASSKSLRDNLIKLIDETEINTVVIDVKDYSGKIVFPIENNQDLKSHGSEDVRVRDMKDFIESLHKKNIYVVARIAVFQDAYYVKWRPDLAVKNASGTEVWKDRKGISWVDPGSREYWDYIVLLSEESRKIGFDEINFDYIRFPSDGNMQDISYPWSSTTPKSRVLKDFFAYLQSELKDTGIKTSADIFGMVTSAKDDMGIGQVLENTLPYFDYIMPMVYPSHYPPNFEGLKEPEAYPYEVIKYSMGSAVTRAESLASTTGQSLDQYKNKLRPWLQDFGLRMTYGPAEVRAQIKAANDLGLTSWILWSPSNKYTKGALNAD